MSDLSELHNEPGHGESFETAIRIQEVPSHHAGVRAEYDYLEQRFGVRGEAWTLRMQSVINYNERTYDRLEISLANGDRKKIYFDVTELFTLPRETTEEQQRRERYAALAALSHIAITEGVEAAMKRWQEMDDSRLE